LKHIEENSLKFLLAAYVKSENNWQIGTTFKEAFNFWGWKHDDFQPIENFLTVQGYIKRHGSGGIEASFNMTPEAVRDIERRLLEGSLPAKLTVTDDENPDENHVVDYQEKVKVRQRQRGEFVGRLYEKSGGDPFHFIPVQAIAKELNLTEAEAMGIVDFLEGQYWLEQKTCGGWNGSVQLTEWAMREIQSQLLAAEKSEDDANKKQSRGPNLGTLQKLKKLREHRLSSIRNGVVTLPWIKGCQGVGIDSQIAKQHDPELRIQWDDPEYI